MLDAAKALEKLEETIMGTERIHGTAQVNEEARIHGPAQVSEEARIHGPARVSGNAQISRGGGGSFVGGGKVSEPEKRFGGGNNNSRRPDEGLWAVFGYGFGLDYGASCGNPGEGNESGVPAGGCQE